MTSNADKFAALFGTPAQSEPPPGPRRPAPVPEAGRGNAPQDLDSIRREQLQTVLNNITTHYR